MDALLSLVKGAGCGLLLVFLAGCYFGGPAVGIGLVVVFVYAFVKEVTGG